MAVVDFDSQGEQDGQEHSSMFPTDTGVEKKIIMK
jgi:hypothetical protein